MQDTRIIRRAKLAAVLLVSMTLAVSLTTTSIYANKSAEAVEKAAEALKRVSAKGAIIAAAGIGLGALVGGCSTLLYRQHKELKSVEADYCTIFVPITIVHGDSEATKKQVTLHNSVYDAVCGDG